MSVFTFYRIKVGDHVYIGSTKYLPQRTWKHNCDLHDARKLTIRLYSCANELGIEELELEKLEEVEFESTLEARKRELELMLIHKADLNMRKPYESREDYLKRKARNQRDYKKRQKEKEILENDINAPTKSADDNEIIGESVELSN
tara:strand:- start:73 stop:510 length:438 start_codon:yes stop_codon:yes gene_type:complete